MIQSSSPIGLEHNLAVSNRHLYSLYFKGAVALVPLGLELFNKSLWPVILLSIHFIRHVYNMRSLVIFEKYKLIVLHLPRVCAA